MKRWLLILILALPLAIAAAADKALVRFPASADLKALQAAGFELYGQSTRYLIGALPAKAKLPQGGRLLAGYRPEGGKLYLLTRLTPEDQAKLSGRVTVLYQEADEALIQAQEAQLKALPPTRAEWLWIATEPQVMRLPESSIPSSNDDFSPYVPGMVEQVSQAQYTQYLQTLQDFGSRNTINPLCDSAAAWILTQFQSFGLDAYYDYFQISGLTRRNVVGERLGTLYPDSVLFITAHYDATIGIPSIPEPVAPGADDNGSGTACVLECARILSMYNFEKTLRFVAFAGEEQGLVGSYYYTSHLQSAGTHVVGDFNYDMVAYAGSGSPPYSLTIYRDGNPFSTFMANKMAEAVVTFVPPGLTAAVVLNPGESGSDHYRFWQHGWPATFSIHSASYPYYHTAQDLISNCSMEFATNVTRAALASLADIAEPLGGGTQVSGAVHGAWDRTGSPYYVTDSIFVPQDSTLTISEGALVLFQGHYPLQIMQNATLKALGSENAPVILTSTDHDTGWAGLRFSQASDSNRLEFCTLSYALNPSQPPAYLAGITCDGSGLEISHCLIHHCQGSLGGAIALSNSSEAALNFVTLVNNTAEQGPGIYCAGSSLQIANSILWDGEGEVYSPLGPAPQVSYSDVYGGFPGTGNQDADPLFVDAGGGNYHLQSVVGSYSGGSFVPAPGYSPALDAADPAAPYANEPEPNGDRADMGSYGNTTQASLSLNDPHYAFGQVHGSWTPANSPMYVISNLTIPPGDSLVISPGVQVIFNGHYAITIPDSAVLIAAGTVQDSIIFSPANPAQGWGGLQFQNAGDSCRLAFCRLSYGLYSGTTGGGINCVSTSLSLSNSVLDHCSTSSGGGVHAVSSNVQINACLFSANSGSIGGGAVFAQLSQLAIRNSRFLNNSATNGGALSLWFSQAQIMGCVFAQDSAGGFGSAIYTLNTPVTLINCTLADNRSNPAGTSGAVHVLGTTSALEVENCILWNNVPQQISAESGATAQVQYSDITGGWTGTGNIDVDPEFQPGPFSAWQLAAISPLVDAGDPAVEFDDVEDPVNPGYALYPAQGLLHNDMGAYGGPEVSGFLGAGPPPEPMPLPRAYSLGQNHPNPFNPVTAISYQLSAISHVSLQVYDVQGRLVSTLVEGMQEAGQHHATFDGSKLASGLYFVRMQAGNYTAVRKMVLLK